MRLWLRKARKEMLVSQLYVAKKLGITQCAYSKIERGCRQVDMSITCAKKLSELFEIPLSTIIRYETEFQKKIS